MNVAILYICVAVVIIVLFCGAEAAGMRKDNRCGIPIFNEYICDTAK